MCLAPSSSEAPSAWRKGLAKKEAVRSLFAGTRSRWSPPWSAGMSFAALRGLGEGERRFWTKFVLSRQNEGEAGTARCARGRALGFQQILGVQWLTWLQMSTG